VSRQVPASKSVIGTSALQQLGQQALNHHNSQQQLLVRVESHTGGLGGDGLRSTGAARRWAIVRAHFFKSSSKPASFVGLLLQKKAARDRFEQIVNAFSPKNPL